MKAPTALVAIALCAICVGSREGVRATDGEDCEWSYACCERDEANDLCKSLCPKPTVVCSLKQGATGPARQQLFNVITSVPCKEGFKLDHLKQCRRIFEHV